nr:acyclic terpene utilization AtuA family protein [Planosporangium thailandense]
MAFWGDSVRPAIEMVERGDIDYLCCDHLAELTMSILAKQRARNSSLGYTRDILDLLRGALPTCVEKGIKVVTNSGGANPRAAAEGVVALCKELGVSGVRVAVVTGDDIETDIDDLIGQGVDFANLDTGEPLSTVRDRLTHAAVYTGCEGIVEALRQGADIVICGRVTDIALYLGPLIHEFGWATDDWERLGMATVVAHAIECGGQATGGLYAGDWAGVDGLENLGYPIAEVAEDGTAVLTKTPASGGRVDVGTVSEQLVYEILDPANYLTADVTADFTGVTLEEVGLDRVRITGGTGKPAPQTLKVNMGYRAGFVGEAQFTYTWPDAWQKAQRGITFLKKRLERAGFEYTDEIIEYLGQTSMWGSRVPEPRDPDIPEIVVRYAARCPDQEQARKVFTESVALYNNGPAGVAGVGTRPPLKELYAIWPCLIPREHVRQSVELLEV